jgi:hypothetical protein
VGMEQLPSYRKLTDDALIAEMPRLAGSERRATVHLVSALLEFERRRLHLPLGYTSSFDYCVRSLRLTEHEALNRIEAARAARRFPALLTKLADAELSLTAIRLLAPHLTDDNFEEVVQQAAGRNTEGIRMLIAKLKPQPPVPSVVRKLPDVRPKPSRDVPAITASRGEANTEAVTSRSVPDVIPTLTAPETPPSRRPIVAPLSEAHFKLQVTISAAARERLQQIQDLMRHRVPSGDPAAIVEHALEVLHAELLKQKAAQVVKPRAGKAAAEARGRYIPASVKRAVWRRDQGQCAFMAGDGRRCGSTSGVEFHHVQPFAAGGAATIANIEMRCRAHNGFEWERHLDAETESLLTR